ncbi:MAG: aspartate carbamoyltransferase [Candidatus Aenigmatarchaeota archaeon]
MAKWENWPHVLDARQFKEKEVLNDLFQQANEMKRVTDKGVKCKYLESKTLACLFYEESTRTRFSFERAMLGLGGNVMSTEDAEKFSSASKGESLRDSIKTIAKYSDVIALRTAKEGSANEAASVSNVPIMNAGDGGDQHPTQALLDIYTINRAIGRIDGLKVAMVGSLKDGRTVRSLAYILAHRDGNELVFVSTPEMGMKDDIKSYLRDEKRMPFSETEELADAVRDVDVVYMTRYQFNRLPAYIEAEKELDRLEKGKAEPAEIEKLRARIAEIRDGYRGRFTLTPEIVGRMRKGSIIMHPLPRNYELPEEIDQDHRSVYFDEVENGLYMRMALLDRSLRND